MISPAHRRLLLVLACHVLMLALAAGHFAVLMQWFEPAIHQPDANGYFAQATHIARDGRTWFEPESPLQYINMHWMKTEDGRYFSHYPPGFGVVLALPFRLGGPAAAMIVNPLMASLTLVGLYLVCAAWVGAGWGLLAAALLAVNPEVNQWALGYFAHTAVAFFLVWGLWFLTRWEKTLSWKWAVPAGLFFGVLPSVRYPAALFCAAAGLFVLVVVLGRKEAWRSALAGLAGAAVPIVLLLVHNQFAFGAFWKTGYALTNEQTGFSWDWFTEHAVSYIETLSGGGAGVLFGVGLVGIAVLCARRRTWRHGALLAALTVPITLLYMSYYWSGGRQASGAMRFLVPTFYVYGIATVWVLRELASVSRAGAVAAGLLLLAVTVGWGVPQSMQALDRTWRPAEALVKLTGVITEHVPPGSLIVAPDTVQQHLEFVGKWRLVDERAMQPGGRGGRVMRRVLERDPSRPSPMQVEKIEERMRRYEDLSPEEVLVQFAADLGDWAGPDRKIYWLVDAERLDRVKRELWLDTFRTVTEIELPEPPADARGGRGFGGFGGGPPGMPGPANPPGGMGAPGGRMRRRPGGGGPMGRMGLVSGGKLLLVEWTVRTVPGAANPPAGLDPF